MSADPQVWRQALPVDPSLGEYPEASKVRPGLFTRFVPVAGQDRQGAEQPGQINAFTIVPVEVLDRAGLPGASVRRRTRPARVGAAHQPHR